MENRRILPPTILKAIDPKHVRVTTPEENAKIEEAIKRRKQFDEGKSRAQAKYKQALKEGAMKRSYTMDEVTVAQLLKGHPMAQEIIDELNKGRAKNESGEEFKDGSEDTIGTEGHAAVARPGSIKHEGGYKGKASDNPGVDAKKASQDDFDLEKAMDIVGEFLLEKGYNLDEVNEIMDEYFGLEKSDNFTDNDPEGFEDGLVGADGEDDSGDGPEGGDVVVGKSADDSTINYLVKTMGEDKAEEFLKAVIGGRRLDPGQVAGVMSGNPQKGHLSGGPAPEVKARAAEEKKRMKDTALRALQSKLGTGGAEKSEGDGDLEKSEGQPPTYQEIEKKQEDVQSGKVERERKAKARIAAAEKSQDDPDLEKAKKGTQKEERAEWAKDPEGEKREHEKEEKSMSNEWSLDFSKSILQRMGLEDVEKGSPDVSARKHGGKIRQISYSSKPESRWEHPKAKEHEKTVYHKKTDEIETETKPKEKGAKWTPKGSRVSIGDKAKMEAKFRPKTKSGGDEGGAEKSEGEFDLHKALDAILEKKTQ